jgi:DNA polymerase-3 subunit epsilon
MRIFLARVRNQWIRARFKDKELPSSVRNNISALDHVSLSEKAISCRYAVVDLETTGLSTKRDRILSIGAVRIVNGRIRLGDTFNEFVNPGRDIPESSIMIHNIVPDMVSTARSPEEVIDYFLGYLGTDILVGHHARFDLQILNRVMRQCYGFCLQNLVLDTVALCRALLFPRHRYPYGIDMDNTEYSLDALARHFGIEIFDRHTSFGDALATAMIFQRVLAKLEKGGTGQLCDLIRAGGISYH